MSNLEIKERINLLENEYLIRLIGLHDSNLKTAFISWLNEYSDGFHSVNEALKAFKEEHA